MADFLVSRQQPWSAYALHLATLSPPALVVDMGLLWMGFKATEGWSGPDQARAMGGLILWILLSKTLKLFGHFLRYPEDIILLPVSILFGYLHGLIKVYALFTLNVVSAGNYRPDLGLEEVQIASIVEMHFVKRSMD